MKPSKGGVVPKAPQLVLDRTCRTWGSQVFAGFRCDRRTLDDPQKSEFGGVSEMGMTSMRGRAFVGGEYQKNNMRHRGKERVRDTGHRDAAVLGTAHSALRVSGAGRDVVGHVDR